MEEKTETRKCDECRVADAVIHNLPGVFWQSSLCEACAMRSKERLRSLIAEINRKLREYHEQTDRGPDIIYWQRSLKKREIDPQTS